MGMIGGDLAAMASLSRRFQAAGETFQSQSSGIANRVSTALDEFVGEMRDLDAQARALAAEIRQEIGRLDAKARGTTWTGSKRGEMDAVIAALDDDIVRIQAAIESFVDEASAVVDGSLTSSMTDLRANVETAGNKAASVAGSFSGSVEQQRARFDQVMNG